MTTELIIDILGWIASVELVTAFALVSYKKLDPDSPTFQWLNLTGSFLFIINTYYHGAYPPMVLNIVWVFISFISLVKIWRKDK